MELLGRELRLVLRRISSHSSQKTGLWSAECVLSSRLLCGRSGWSMPVTTMEIRILPSSRSFPIGWNDREVQTIHPRPTGVLKVRFYRLRLRAQFILRDQREPPMRRHNFEAAADDD